MQRTIDQALIDAYAEVTGDRNPIHVDPEFATSTPYGGTIAHGLLVAAVTADALEPAPRPPYDLEIVFLRPVHSGTTITVELTRTEEGVQAVATADEKPVVAVRRQPQPDIPQDEEGEA